MDIALLIVRLGLFSVFAVAGVAKIADRDGTRAALTAFGVGERLVAPLSLLLPLVELAVAALLVPTATAVSGAAAAFILLVVFTAGVARALRHGERPDCNCFGGLQSAPIGWRTHARNGLLAAVAATVMVGGAGKSATAWIKGPLAVVTLGLGCISAALAAVLWLLLCRHGEVRAELERLSTPPAILELGARAPPFDLPSVRGEMVSLDDVLRWGVPAMLVFADPACGPCADLMPDIVRWQREHAGRMTFTVISSGERELNLAQAEENAITTISPSSPPHLVLRGHQGVRGSIMARVARGRRSGPSSSSSPSLVIAPTSGGIPGLRRETREESVIRSPG